jgi:hypothetical protein
MGLLLDLVDLINIINSLKETKVKILTVSKFSILSPQTQNPIKFLKNNKSEIRGRDSYVLAL